MFELTAILTLLAVAVALSDWRKGLIMVLLIGAIQDPFRKLVAGTPAYYILWSTGVFMAVVAAAYLRRRLPPLDILHVKDPPLRLAWSLFAGIVILHAVHALARWGNPAMPVLGLLFYFGPVVGLLVGAAYARTSGDIHRFLLYYALIAAPVALTIYLSPWLGEHWPVLQDVGVLDGTAIVIYDLGTALASHSGLFRTGEIAAWHAATAAIFLIILVGSRRATLVQRVIVAVVVVLLIGAIVLTGRRKMLMALTLFLVFQWFLLAFFRRGLSRLTVTVLVLGVVGSFGFLWLESRDNMVRFYADRGITVFADSEDRFQLALDLMQSAIERSGGLGLGTGVSSQGARYAGGGVAGMGGAAEAGLGKIVIELGIPGALIILWLLAAMALNIRKGLSLLARVDAHLLYLEVSLIAFLLANIATFTVATQLFGDFFILSVLGLSAGFVFRLNSAGRWLHASQRARPWAGHARALASVPR